MKRKMLKWGGYGALGALILATLWVSLYAVINPSTTPYMRKEAHRLGDVRRSWRDLEDVVP